ncbi:MULTISPECIES: helix-turn-helix transcriptional regulator [unclassified Micromonospora]|uniref:helix-turn-helix domain-containing protein n=1 Tax=unclassified Micromonospora TaxID=2617518 RepID=UPI0022B722CE|nr:MULTISPECIES: helix-turn-helix transcriptional regulator [unclassified Micromonospora]MCZ7420362.1 helix-turn-helix transcriptional regulator [Verrucosispora sp. WMMA2121]WBB89140.1 helix-turn-helix transcriptional regulator [Verrucosispora sp. WMMC514]
MDDPGSTVPRRQLGRYLRELRENAHVTVVAAAKELEWSTPRIWRYETGQVPMHPNDVEAMCRVYGATHETIQTMRSLARETKAHGWWHSYGEAIEDWFKLYVGLEAAATKIRKYEADLVPGLLQTVEYMTEVIATNHPDLSQAEQQVKVDVRLRRQRLLARAVPRAPYYDVILSEAVLRRPLRDRAAMARQLDALVVAGRQHNIKIRVLPLAAGLFRSTDTGTFTMLDFPTDVREPEPTTIYMDGPCGAVYLDKPHEIRTYEEVWRSLGERALDVDDSRELITAIAKEMTHET